MNFIIRIPRASASLTVPLAFLWIFCSYFESSSRAAIEAQPAPTVYITKSVRSELFEVLSYPARVIPKINTTILSEIDGVVSHIFTPLGQSVRAGQKLMTLSHTDPVYQYAPVSVSSSVAGVVSGVEVTEGSQITKGQKLISVTNPSQVRITVEIPAQDLEAFSRNLTGDFKMSGWSETRQVRVRGVSPFVDPSTGTASAELEFVTSNRGGSRNKDALPYPTLRPGLIGQVVFKTNIHLGISIPDHAVFYKGNSTFIRLIENGKAKQVPVSLGKKRRGLVEILKGLDPNAIVVERSSRFVADGETVKIEEDNPTPLSTGAPQAK